MKLRIKCERDLNDNLRYTPQFRSMFIWWDCDEFSCFCETLEEADKELKHFLRIHNHKRTRIVCYIER